MKDLSKHIETLLDNINCDNIKCQKEVTSDHNSYVIKLTHNIGDDDFDGTYEFIEFVYRVKIRQILHIYFPNGEIDYKLVHEYITST